MNNIHNFQQRINKMLAHIEPQLPQEQAALVSAFSLHLFTDQEVARIYSLLKLIEGKCENLARENVRPLSDEELDQLHLWMKLDQALRKGDTTTATACRRWLSISTEQLTQAFLAIDESSIPAFDQAPKRDGKTYYRTFYRSDKGNVQRAMAGNQLGLSELETMRLWCDVLSTVAA